MLPEIEYFTIIRVHVKAEYNDFQNMRWFH